MTTKRKTTKRKPRKPASKPTAQHPAEVQLQLQYQISARALENVRDRDARIAALEADLADAHARIATQRAAAAAATVDIDAMVRDVLTQDHKRNAYGPPPLLVIHQRSDEMHASLCVASGGTVLPYRSAWNFGHTIAEAVIALVHNIDPRRDVTGMCDGLRALHGAAS